jgi:hypothetical protein
MSKKSKKRPRCRHGRLLAECVECNPSSIFRDAHSKGTLFLQAEPRAERELTATEFAFAKAKVLAISEQQVRQAQAAKRRGRSG